jgi:exodeoxyribonuclease VII large subunit
LVTPDRAEWAATVQQWSGRLAAALPIHLKAQRHPVQSLTRALAHLAPQMRLANARQRVDDLAERADLRLRDTVRRKRERLQGVQARLHALNPLAVLQRGYAVVRHATTGAVITSVAHIAPGERLLIRIADGEFTGVAE